MGWQRARWAAQEADNFDSVHACSRYQHRRFSIETFLHHSTSIPHMPVQDIAFSNAFAPYHIAAAAFATW